MIVILAASYIRNNCSLTRFLIANSESTGSAGVVSIEGQNAVAWNAFSRELDPDGSYEQSTFMQLISSGGKPVWKQPALLDKTRIQHPDKIKFVSIGNGEGIVAWSNASQFIKNNPGKSGQDIDDEPYQYDIHIQKIDKSGNRAWKSNGIPVTN